MAVALIAAVLVAALGAGVFLLVRGLRRAIEGGAGAFDRRLDGMEDSLARRLGELDGRVDSRLEGLDSRLLSTQKSAGETAERISERLGHLGSATAQMLQRASDLARLEQALRPPKARGGVGELLLENLLRDCLPASAYRLQHTFKTGERVDAVVKVDRLVPVDAKFPLENFERLAAAESEAEKDLHARAFARDVRAQVDSIAVKYIRPAEGTYDFALMYLPSESVYYELVCGKTGELSAYARSKRVFPVSPTTLHAYMQVILLGLRGMQIERHAQDVMAYCAQLAKDFERFRSEFDVVGKHIGNAQSKFGEAERRLARLGAGLERAADWQQTTLPEEAAEIERPALEAV